MTNNNDGKPNNIVYVQTKRGRKFQKKNSVLMTEERIFGKILINLYILEIAQAQECSGLSMKFFQYFHAEHLSYQTESLECKKNLFIIANRAPNGETRYCSPPQASDLVLLPLLLKKTITEYSYLYSTNGKFTLPSHYRNQVQKVARYDAYLYIYLEF